MCRDLLTWSIVQRAIEARCMVLRILANVLPALCGDLFAVKLAQSSGILDLE